MAEIRVSATGELKLYDSDDSNYVSFKSAGTVSSNVAWVLPSADGSSGQALTTNGSGTLSWADAGSADPSSADGDSLGTASAEWSDLYLADGGIVYFGNDQDIRLTHNADKGLILKHSATADDKPVILTLQTGETDMAQDDVMGKIEFQAPDEGTGTDAVLVAAAIQAVAEGDFSSSSNATRLEFMTGSSEAATSQMTISSGGIVGIGAVPTGDLGVGLHIKTADASASVHADQDELVVENSANSGISIVSGNTSKGSIAFIDNGGVDGKIEYDQNTQSMALKTNDTTAISMDSAGHVTKPLNPAFMTQQTGALSVANGHTIFSTNTTERYDVNSDISGATFTAPVTGKYQLNFCVLYESVTSDTTFEPKLQTSNRTYASPPQTRAANGDGTYLGTTGSYLCDMDANDTAIVVHVGPTADVSVSANWSWFTGTLVG